MSRLVLSHDTVPVSDFCSFALIHTGACLSSVTVSIACDRPGMAGSSRTRAGRLVGATLIWWMKADSRDVSEQRQGGP